MFEALPPLRRSCAAWRMLPPEYFLGGEGLGSRAGDWVVPCAMLATLPPRPAGSPRARRVVAWVARMREYFEQGFTIAEIGTATMTGYYEPTLRGEPARSNAFATALLAVPPRDWARRVAAPAPTDEAVATEADLTAPPSIAPNLSGMTGPTTAEASPQPPNLPDGPALAVVPDAGARPAGGVSPLEPGDQTPPGAIGPRPTRRAVTRSVPAIVPRAPFPSRAEIEDGALDGQGLELVWVDSAVDAFFLHIQGSGRVVLADGTLLRLGYAAQNGHPYRAIGRILIERGALRREEMSMAAIRAWLAAAPPEAAAALLRANASYIFFRLVTGLRPEDGPIGAMGVSLTPLRSVAVDPAFVPMGAPVFLTNAPETRPAQAGTAPLPRLLVAQDTGGAIRGAGRSDLFWGWDAESGPRAGGTNQPARMFLLRPRPSF